ncbi:MAG: hypothetical protein IIC62_03820, partial [Proteobacteria bacterium]|nr:hypothetical protein [Pseudomonadota bacterium]
MKPDEYSDYAYIINTFEIIQCNGCEIVSFREYFETDFDLFEVLTASRELAATLEMETADFVSALEALSRLPVEGAYEKTFGEREEKREECEKLNSEIMELGMEIDIFD